MKFTNRFSTSPSSSRRRTSRCDSRAERSRPGPTGHSPSAAAPRSRSPPVPRTGATRHADGAAARRPRDQHVPPGHVHAQDIPSDRAQDQLPLEGRQLASSSSRRRPGSTRTTTQVLFVSEVQVLARRRDDRRARRLDHRRRLLEHRRQRQLARSAVGTSAQPANGTPVSVVNAGIGSNRFEASDGAGLSGLHRLPDVLALPGVKWVVIFEGINDISYEHASAARSSRRTRPRSPRLTPPAWGDRGSATPTDRALGEGRRQQRGHARGRERLDPHERRVRPRDRLRARHGRPGRPAEPEGRA